MMQKKWIIIFLFSLFSCVEKYESNIVGETDFLVVEAEITNLNEPYKVKLSRTTSLNSNTIVYENGATVEIEASSGNTTTLTPKSEGVYETNPMEFVGSIGDSYILRIYTSDGEMYESDPVVLNEVIELDEVYFALGEQENFDDGTVLKTVDIIANTKTWGNDSEYYFKWEYVETYKLFPTYSVMDRPEIPHVPCYNIIKNDEIIIDNSSLFSENKIQNKKLFSILENETKPYFGYTVSVRLVSLNESVFQFWKMLKESTENNGDMFDNIPYNAKSNIHCVTNDDKKAFGYFNASEVSEKRISFDPPIFDLKFSNYYDKCVPISKGYLAFLQFLQLMHMDSSDVYIYDMVEEDIVFFIDRECVDCSQTSTTTEMPDYWPFD